MRQRMDETAHSGLAAEETTILAMGQKSLVTGLSHSNNRVLVRRP